MRIDTQRSSRPVAIWLLIGVAMIIVQIILGGITRLTGSGLSITEWKPILGIIPPLNGQEWQAAFSKYQEIAQFKHLNFHFTLEDFKFIYFWEWFHRLWGRLLGVVFAIPFLIFLVQRRFRADMIRPLVILFLLGGLQGVIGWIMVKSGLNDEDLYVSHFRLAIHFIAAVVLLVYTYWFALKLLIHKNRKQVNPGLRTFAIWLIVLLGIQLTYGAFMAGLKAGVAAPTWPDINGQAMPNITVYQGKAMSLGNALFNNPIAIHVVHRGLAYLLTALILIWTISAFKQKRSRLFNAAKWWPLLLVLLQVFLGVMSVLTSYRARPQGWGPFEWYAQLHQVVALFLLLALVNVVYLLRSHKTRYSTAGIAS
jgi:heme a synthase